MVMSFAGDFPKATAQSRERKTRGGAGGHAKNRGREADLGDVAGGHDPSPDGL